MKFFKESKPDEKIRSKVLNRLRNTEDYELIRWIDNTHTAIGMNISEMRKSLTSSNKEQAFPRIEDIRAGAVSLLAAMQVLEERVNPE